MITKLKPLTLKISLVQAAIATVGSLYLSEVVHIIPCSLCWYQRICMFPITVILAVGIWDKNHNIAKYVWPFGVTGWIIALYQNLLIYGAISQPVFSCTLGADCADKGVTFLGFITFPLLSLAAFTVINICMYVYSRIKDNK